MLRHITEILLCPPPSDRHFIPPIRLLTLRYAFYLSVNVIVGLCSDSVFRLD